MIRSLRLLAVVAVASTALALPSHARAQQPTRDPDLNADALQPEFSLATLPTTLRVPAHKSAFRVTHRFGRPLGSGDFGDLASDMFGLDSSAQIGLEYRYGLMSGTQIGVYRTNDRTTEFFVERSLWQQSASRPVSVVAIASAEGTNNFRDSYTPALGVEVSRKVGRVAAVYAMPQWVNNTNPLPAEVVDHNSTFVLGLGTRVRVLRTTYLVLEGSPRVGGYKPGVNHVAFGVEKVVGGHTFQLNFSNSVGTTPGQVARGGGSNSDWYMGFNIARKFWR